MAKVCYAPVFRGNNWLACIILIIIYTLAIVGIIIATLGLCLLFETCRCTIKQYQFRISRCTQGNANPELPI